MRLGATGREWAGWVLGRAGRGFWAWPSAEAVEVADDNVPLALPAGVRPYACCTRAKGEGPCGFRAVLRCAAVVETVGSALLGSGLGAGVGAPFLTGVDWYGFVPAGVTALVLTLLGTALGCISMAASGGSSSIESCVLAGESRSLPLPLPPVKLLPPAPIPAAAGVA